jgi:DNA repair protein RadC
MRVKDRVSSLRVTCVREHSVPIKDGTVGSAREAAKVARLFVPDGEEREHFIIIMLDARRSVKGVAVVSIGTLSASLVHPRECFRPAIVAGAAAVIAVHNHPSGDPTPSAEDRDVTRRLQKAGELIGIPLADHVVVGAGESFYSFREHGIL